VKIKNCKIENYKTMAYRNEKIIEQIKHLAADFLERESNRGSLITVTAVILSDDTKNATIYVTVLPDNKEKAATDFLKRKRSEFKEYFKKHSSIGRIPFFDFQIDLGQKNAIKINELLK
jgi:ribosome-binding factor A